MSAPNPDEVLILTCPYPLAPQEDVKIERLVRELGFEDRKSERWGSGRRHTLVRRWTLDVVHSVAQAMKDAAPADVLRDSSVTYAAVRRALRACVDPEFRRAFWAARLLGGYRAGGEFLLENAPERRTSRNSRYAQKALNAAWALSGPEATAHIVDALNAIAPGGILRTAGLVVRRGKAYVNDHRYWVASPYLGREFALPGVPERLVRLIWEREMLAAWRPEDGPR